MENHSTASAADENSEGWEPVGGRHQCNSPFSEYGSSGSSEGQRRQSTPGSSHRSNSSQHSKSSSKRGRATPRASQTMPSTTVNSSSISQRPQLRFIFSIERDINVLEAALNINPFQLGRPRWNMVAEDVRERWGYVVSARTLRERVETLLRKFRNEELTSKKGTEEQQTQRAALLTEIISIVEGDQAAINEEKGAEDDHTPDEEVNRNRRREGAVADKEREVILQEAYPDAAPEPSTSGQKRQKNNKEENLVELKLRHDMEMERRRFELEAEIRRAEVKNESKRLQLELEREKRLAEDAERQERMYSAMQTTLNVVLEIVKRKQ
ncbi:uncharacterized protein LOC108736784 isoform X2 [Agrilus planipennis]|uniref:Uncharacterized protein LOC108736784 isoform X2 n=1 Tax=Agrilus planipennis TaxID=224129 RepID=A0A1W4WLQ2_AGRPL|nr:uncharacterized protein LOC108736784 isoform X2 [Agrilus planipennis]